MLRPQHKVVARDSNRISRTVLLLSQSANVIKGIQKKLIHIPEMELETFESHDAAMDQLESSLPSLVLVHLGPTCDEAGVELLLKYLGRLEHSPALIVLGECNQTQQGLNLLKLGAADYLEWPRDGQRLAMLIELLSTKLSQKAAKLPQSNASTKDTSGVIYSPDSALARLMDQLKRVAPVQTTVLFQGETGTGKTLLARVLHQQSSQHEGPFIEVNCATLTESLFESELFGHTKGAFTGAVRERNGRLTSATNGTLFLDEVDTLSLTLQAKLLRVLEGRTFEPVGSDVTQTVDNVRFVAASNRSLEQEVSAGRFRADLYFRLGVMTFNVPPLREQDSNMFSALVEQFIAEFATKARREIAGITPDAMAALLSEKWPGNIRQLRNVIERAVALRPEGMIELEDLPDDFRANSKSNSLIETDQELRLVDIKDQAEKSQIAAVLRRTQNNRSHAAAALGISRNTLYNRLRQYGLLNVMF